MACAPRIIPIKGARAAPWSPQIRDVSDALARLLLELRPADDRWIAETRARVVSCRAFAGGLAPEVPDALRRRDLDRYLASLDIVDAGLRHRRADVLDRAYVMLEEAVARFGEETGA
ncbi:MAG: hypothetical protein IT304_03025 [Dehalococcoidia bacterium]|nr:hypothetical protein [Dehalococcoidia bacterium]